MLADPPAHGLRAHAEAPGEERPGGLVFRGDGGAHRTRRSTAPSRPRPGIGFACAGASSGVFSACCGRWPRGASRRRSSATCRGRRHSARRGAARNRRACAAQRRHVGARTRSLPKGIADGRLGKEILDAVAAGLLDSPDPPPAVAQKAQNPPGLGPLIELLRVLLKQRCEDYEVAQKLVASADDLEAIAVDDEAAVPALTGWRHEVFGADALPPSSTVTLALSTAGRNRIELVALPAPRHAELTG